MVVALCDGESVKSVALYRLAGESRELLWRVEGRSPDGVVFSSTAGVTPEGFAEVTALGVIPPASDLLIVADTTGGVAADSEQVFTLSELRAGVLDDGRIGSEDVTVDDLKTRALLNCDRFSVPWDDLPLVMKVAYVAAGVGLVGAVFVLVRLLLRRRNRRRDLQSPSTTA